MKVRRGSDNTDVILNYLASGVVDVASAIAWYGANRRAGAQVYDQTGNGHHLVQATDSAKPGFAILPEYAFPLIEFNQGSVDPLSYPNGLSQGDKAFTLDGVTMNSSTGCTVYQVVIGRDRTFQATTQMGAVGNMVYGSSATTPFLAIGGGGQIGSPPALYCYRNTSGIVLQSRPCNLRPSVMAHRFQDVSPHVVLNFDARSVQNTALNSFSQTLTEIGVTGPYVTQGCALLAKIIFPTRHSDAQVAQMQSLLQRKFGFLPPTWLLVFDGDSITGGYQFDNGTFDDRQKSWPFQLVNSMRLTDARAINIAVSGRTIAEMRAWLGAMAGSEVDAIYTRKIYVVCAGSNDIRIGNTAAATWTALQGLVSDVRALGYTKVIGITYPPRDDNTAPQAAELVALSALVRGSVGVFDGIADVEAQNWKPDGTLNSTTQDGTHPNAPGRTLFVNAVTPVLAAVL